MNIVYAARKFAVAADTSGSIRDAFVELGHDVRTIGLDKLDGNKKLEDIVNGVDPTPDLVLIHQAHKIRKPEILMRLKCKVVQWIPDCIFTVPGAVRRGAVGWAKRGRYCDLVLSTYPADLDFYRKQGCGNVKHLPQGCDRRYFKPQKRAKTFKLTFVGTEYGSFRRQVLKRVRRHHRELLTFGYGFRGVVRTRVQKEITKVKSGEIFANSLATIGMSELPSSRNGCSNRVWNAMGSGTAIFQRYTPMLDEMFDDGKHLVLWKNVNDLLEKLRYYLDRPKDLIAIGKRASDAIRESHTYTHRVRCLLEMVGELDVGNRNRAAHQVLRIQDARKKKRAGRRRRTKPPFAARRNR